MQLSQKVRSVAQSQYQISPVDPVLYQRVKIRCRQNFPGSLIPSRQGKWVSPAKCSPGSFLISQPPRAANAVQNRSPAPDKENIVAINFEQHRLDPPRFHRCPDTSRALARVNTVMTSVPCSRHQQPGDKGFVPDAPDAPLATSAAHDPRLFVIHRHNAAVANASSFFASHGLRPNCLVIRTVQCRKAAPSQSAAYRFPVSIHVDHPAVRGDLALLPQA